MSETIQTRLYFTGNSACSKVLLFYYKVENSSSCIIGNL